MNPQIRKGIGQVKRRMKECIVETIYEVTERGLAGWRKPDTDRIKINTDAAINRGAGMVGLGWVARDSTGAFLAGAAIPRKGVCLPKEAEALSMREALSWIKAAGWDQVDVESDALHLVEGVHSASTESSFGLLVNDIKELATSFSSITFSHVKRSANRVAHHMARAAVSMSDSCLWQHF
ncbi:unnamed protein product, partial [Cuscuta epithymum]